MAEAVDTERHHAAVVESEQECLFADLRMVPRRAVGEATFISRGSRPDDSTRGEHREADKPELFGIGTF